VRTNYTFSVCKSVHLHTFKRTNTNQMQQLITGSLFVVQIHLNMFRASSCPSSGAHKLQQQPTVPRKNAVVAVPLIVVGPVVTGPTTTSGTATTAFLPWTGGRCCSWLASDDGQEDAPNMLSCIWTTSSEPVINCCIWLVLVRLNELHLCITMSPPYLFVFIVENSVVVLRAFRARRQCGT